LGLEGQEALELLKERMVVTLRFLILHLPWVAAEVEQEPELVLDFLVAQEAVVLITEVVVVEHQGKDLVVSQEVTRQYMAVVVVVVKLPLACKELPAKEVMEVMVNTLPLLTS